MVKKPTVVEPHEQTVDMVVAVKAYPVVSQRHREAVCVAGIRTDRGRPEWVRLFPVGFRELPSDRQFAKYQWMRVKTIAPRSDRRPETRTPLLDSVELGEKIDTRYGWLRRMDLLEPLRADSMCELVRRQRLDGTSLGIFSPADVDKLVIEPEPDWSPRQRMILDQPSLLAATPKGSLEKPPLSVSYRYRCDDPACKGHKQKNVDWEVGEACRSWSRRAADSTDLRRMVEQKWLDEMCAPGRDTSFVVGSQHQYPDKFLILSVVWPPKRAVPAQLGFDLAA